MGKAKIVSHIADSEYNIIYYHDMSIIDNALIKVDDEISSFESQITAIEIEITDKNAELSLKSDTLDAKIILYQSCVTGSDYKDECKEEKEALNKSNIDFLTVKSELGALDEKESNLEISLDRFKQYKKKLDALTGEETTTAWCVDLCDRESSEPDAGSWLNHGEIIPVDSIVGTIEIFDFWYKRYNIYIVAASYSRLTSAAYDADVHGFSGHALASNEDGFVYNYNMRGPQSTWHPKYRLAIVNSITSGIAQITFNQQKDLDGVVYNTMDDSADSDIPCDYMKCSTSPPFEPGDQVVVEFDGDKMTLPHIIGYSANPQVCLLDVLYGLCVHAPDTSGPTYNYRLYDDPTDNFDDNTETSGMLALSDVIAVIEFKTDKQYSSLDVIIQSPMKESYYRRYYDVSPAKYVPGGFHRYNAERPSANLYYQNRLIAPVSWFYYDFTAKMWALGLTVIEKTDGLHILRISGLFDETTGVAGQFKLTAFTIPFSPTATASEIANLTTTEEGSCIVSYTSNDSRDGGSHTANKITVYRQHMFLNKAGTKGVVIAAALLDDYNNDGVIFSETYLEYYVFEVNINIASDSVELTGSVIYQGTDFPYGLDEITTGYSTTAADSDIGAYTEVTTGTPPDSTLSRSGNRTTQVTETHSAGTSYTSSMPIGVDYDESGVVQLLTADLTVYIDAIDTSNTNSCTFAENGQDPPTNTYTLEKTETRSYTKNGYECELKLNGVQILEKIQGYEINDAGTYNYNADRIQTTDEFGSSYYTQDDHSAIGYSKITEIATFISLQFIDLRDSTFIYDKLKTETSIENSETGYVNTNTQAGTVDYTVHYNEHTLGTYSDSFNDVLTNGTGQPSELLCNSFGLPAGVIGTCTGTAGDNLHCTWGESSSSDTTHDGFKQASVGHISSWLGKHFTYNGFTVDARRTRYNSMLATNISGNPYTNLALKDQFPSFIKSMGAILTNDANKSASPLHYIKMTEDVLNPAINPLSIADTKVYFKGSVVVPPAKNLTLEPDTKKVFYR